MKIFAFLILFALVAIRVYGQPVSIRTNTVEIKFNQEMEPGRINAANIKNSKFYALIIAVKDYKASGIDDLAETEEDAKQLKNILTTHYQFDSSNITFLIDPTRQTIIQTLDTYSEQLTLEDNLLIFYSGHGQWDARLSQGYWLPADAEINKRTNWLSNSDLRDYMRGIGAKHILLLTDACFGGSIIHKERNVKHPSSTPSAFVQQMYKSNSRKAITSGAMQTVPAKSMFMKYFLEALQRNQQDYLSAEALYDQIKEPITNNTPNRQVPVFGVIQEAGDLGDGNFIFIKKGVN